MSVCLIPAWRRPEMLWHCLQNVRLATGAEEYFYLFRFDQDHDPDLHKVVKDFPFRHAIAITPRTKYQLAKQSYSLLTGMQAAADMCTPGGDCIVVMIEEDVMVGRDFFRWHRAIHDAHPTLFAAVASANPNRRVVDTGEAGDYYRSSGDYCGIGVSWSAGVVRGFIAPHMATRYFNDPIRYCAETWPKSPFGKSYAEQDGLIRRIQWKCGADKPIAWPYVPKCYHAGFYGKNRGSGPMGDLGDRIRRISEIIYSEEGMRTFAKHPEWFEDSRPINLDTPPWTTLRSLPLDPIRNPLRA